MTTDDTLADMHIYGDGAAVVEQADNEDGVKDSEASLTVGNGFTLCSLLIHYTDDLLDLLLICKF